MSWNLWYILKATVYRDFFCRIQRFLCFLDRMQKPIWKKMLHVPSVVDHVNFSNVDMHKARHAFYACCCSTLQHMLHHKRNTLQHTAVHCNRLQRAHDTTCTLYWGACVTPVHRQSHCNTPQHIVTRCNTYIFAQAILSRCMTPSTDSRIERRNLFENKNIRNTTWIFAVLSK